MKPFRIAVFFSGLERSLVGSAYNLRQDECKAAAYSLLAYAGMEYGKFRDTRLRDVPEEIFNRYKDRLPDNFRLRAEHYFDEFARTQAGTQAWSAGDIERYGELVFESGRSSIEKYQCGCPELIRLYEIMLRTDGIYGGRFSGAGFKGCCMALVETGKAEEVLANVGRAYLKAFPGLEGQYLGVLCDSADGAEV
jgi:galactokinase/galacturonokinase